MNQTAYMLIREFSRLSGIRPANLRFYDQIGLLTPEHRGENGYRYYTQRQLNTAYLISDLRELGVGLEEIKRYAGERTPARMIDLFADQERRIRLEMDRLRSMREIMKLREEMARQALSHEENVVVVEPREREPLFLGPLLPGNLPDDEGILLTYDTAGDRGLPLGYPMGAMIERAAFEAGDLSRVSRYYFRTRRGRNGWKPAGLYAAIYGRCAMGLSDELYRLLLAAIRERRLAVVSDTYEEYLLDEMSTMDENQYVVRIEVRVEAKETI